MSSSSPWAMISMPAPITTWTPTSTRSRSTGFGTGSTCFGATASTPTSSGYAGRPRGCRTDSSPRRSTSPCASRAVLSRTAGGLYHAQNRETHRVGAIGLVKSALPRDASQNGPQYIRGGSFVRRIIVAPAISLVITVYNCRQFLPYTWEAIQRQTFHDFEIVLLDDCSTDGTREMCQEFAAQDSRVKLLFTESNQKLIRSLNICLDHCEGKYVARQDGDDIPAPQRLALQYAYMEKHPQVVLLGSQRKVIDEHGRLTGVPPDLPGSDAGIRAWMTLRTAILACAVMMRRDVIEEHGLRYPLSALHAEDFAFYASLVQHGQAANLPQRLMLSREYGTSLSSIHALEAQANAKKVAQGNYEQALARFIPCEEWDIIMRIATITEAVSREELDWFQSSFGRIMATYRRVFGLGAQDYYRLQQMLFTNYLYCRRQVDSAAQSKTGGSATRGLLGPLGRYYMSHAQRRLLGLYYRLRDKD
eukprot:TRINITY_DN10274_c0_g2_i1.p2 TRINITY_DN10274_c0_g2~~TRINITY_DN10274_c0_g2_i1.p2  ORF type:complete len:476 (-),score=116.59 TRINITY_DN10274_c0_g2_i1:740-2167(-)